MLHVSLKNNLHQQMESPLICIGGFDNSTLHAAGHCDLLGEVLLGLHHGILNLVVSFHLHDHLLQAAIQLFQLEDEVRVIAAHGA